MSDNVINIDGVVIVLPFVNVELEHATQLMGRVIVHQVRLSSNRV